MRRNCLSVIWMLLLFPYLIAAQQEPCYADKYLENQLAENPKFAKQYKRWKAMNKIDVSLLKTVACTEENTVIIPVAIHYNTPITCADNACLLSAAESQITQMNLDFSASNADLSQYTTGLNGACENMYPLDIVPEIGDGTCVQFCLATQDHPNCSGISDGEPAITIDQYTWQSQSKEWTGYLNIYVSNTITAGLDNGIVGVSPLPGSGTGDGIFVRNSSFGGPGVSCFSGGPINTDDRFNMGRTAVHEVGHYLGLPHVFTNNETCDDPDENPPGPIGVFDTPEQTSPHYNCPSVTTCSDVPMECNQPQNFFNFMDYADDNCKVLFTVDQSEVISYWANSIPWKSNTVKCSATAASTPYCPPAPSCTDGILNGNENGIDCGGACAPCEAICSSLFFDSGGPCKAYTNMMNDTVTICPDNSGSLLTINFSEFDIEEKDDGSCWDYIKVYDGEDITSPQMGGEYCGNTVANAPGSGSISASSPGQCLTFVFHSDNFVTETGWNAEVQCLTAVPVDFISFSSVAHKQSIELKWITAIELNNERFDIYRSESDTENFEVISSINASNAINETKNYTYTDTDLIRGEKYFYQLIQVDLNGQTSRSQIISQSIGNGKVGDIDIFPNPMKENKLNIKFKPLYETIDLEIYTSAGVKVLDRKGLRTESCILDDLKQGIYFVKILANGQYIASKKLLKM